MKCILAASALCTIAVAPALADEWGYTGAHDPSHWSGTCATGAEQSPIDLDGEIEAEIEGPALFWGTAEADAVRNAGHALQVDFAEGAGMVLDGVEYGLLQFHIHTPSEHTLAGEAFPMEVHFVHAAEDGRLAVLGVFFAEGVAHPELDALIAAMPATAGISDWAGDLDLDRFLPAETEVLRYAGSLTTPPCSEIVSWSVYDTPVEASAEQIAALQALFGANARPVQPINRRFLLIAD
ncbi:MULTISPECIES: carbonic anhydrase [Hyphobacterium]|uniref:Carbonic anhydrase n=1 Tax=Hyphobacterium vulgare TaxID=1736751 RepID=A0ABV6ZYE5_9PROT